MEELLRGLRRSEAVIGAFVVGRAGELLAATPAGQEAELQGALLGSLTGALEQALGHLGLGSLSDTVVEADGGTIVAASCGEGRTVVVLAQGHPNVGLIRLELRKARRAIEGAQGAQVANQAEPPDSSGAARGSPS